MRKYLLSASVCALLFLAPLMASAQTAPAAPCCSSVFFIPGIEASKLVSITSKGTTAQRWAPFGNGDVQYLYMDDEGNPLHNDIHPEGPLWNAYGIAPIYQKFLAAMTALAHGNVIARWQAYAYDWRLPVDQVAHGSIGASTTVQTIEWLASDSKTGKVSIIAHSNGGLVAKLIYDALRAKGEESLVDRIILVAVPELGTPQAIAGLLHGDDQAIGHGLLLSGATARTLGANMPSAYGLLPSQAYFEGISDAVMRFASSTIGGMDFSRYFPSISSYAGVRSFLADPSHGAVSTTTNVPVTANARLLPHAEGLHSALDMWKPASSTDLVAIAGWGLGTTAAVDYYDKIVCAIKMLFTKVCVGQLAYADERPLVGDGTVTATSSLFSSAVKQVFNMGAYDRDLKKKAAHADILEADPVISVLQADMKGNYDVSGVPYMSNGIPGYAFPDQLVVSVHSPAELHIYDKEGNHTGPIPAPAGVPADIVHAYQDDIPGSSYHEGGDGPSVTLPWSPDYKIAIDGTGIGTVMADVSVMKGGMDESASSTFQGLLVSPFTRIELVSGLGAGEADSYRLARIDLDGDGTFDATATPDMMPDVSPEQFWDSIRNGIIALGLDPSVERSVLRRMDKAPALLKEGKVDRADSIMADLEQKTVPHISSKKATDADRKELLALIDYLLAELGV